MDCAIYVAKTKVLISCAVTAQLICTFVFTGEKSRFFMMRLIYSRIIQSNKLSMAKIEKK